MITPPEELRRAVLAHLATRFPVAQSASTIAHRLAREFVTTTPDVETACQFLADLHLLEIVTEPLGSTKYYKATSQGVLHHERNP